MSTRSVLVTGASGFMGRHLSAYLRSRNWRITELDSTIDIRNQAAVQSVIEEAKPDALIHLAAVASPSIARSNPIEAWEINVSGTFNLIRSILASSPKSKFIYVGSSESYGNSFNTLELPLKETAALAPTHSYGITKAAADQMVGLMADEGLNAVRLRPFNCTGPGQSSNYVISSFARQIAEIERTGGAGSVTVGNLDSERDFVDIRDVVRACAAACTTDLPAGTALNLSTGHAVSIRSALDLLVSLSTSKIAINVDPLLVRPLEIKTSAGDISRAKHFLGWQPEIKLSQTLKDVLDFWRGALRSQHPD